MLFLFYLRVRIRHLHNFPRPNDQGGPMLICANHQSNLDPILMGVACPFPINYLAKKSLFDFKPLGWFLNWNDAIPLDRDASGIGGIKETLRRLKRGESVLIFPEGMRSPDGTLQEVKQGFCTLAKRTKVPLVPVAIAGAYQSYPRSAWFPLPGKVEIVIGEPIQYAQYQQLDDSALAALIQQHLAALVGQATDFRDDRRRLSIDHDRQPSHHTANLQNESLR